MINEQEMNGTKFLRSIKVHFVGIGGTGMCGIAELLINLNYSVSGSDISINDAIIRLKELGAKFAEGHNKDNVTSASVVVYSSAIKPNNVELVEARKRKIPTIPRAEMLGELMRMKYSIAIAGSHGKTTTTSLVASILYRDSLDPTFVIGGRLNAFGSNARLGEGEFLVAEADESDGTFLDLSPTVALVTNVDEEHLDFYENYQSIKDAFLQFVNKVPFYGFSVLCYDNLAIREIIPNIEKRFFTYGFDPSSDYLGKDFRYVGEKGFFDVYHLGSRLGEIQVPMPGMHNASNALGAVALAMEINIPFESVKIGLEEFEGISRRMEFLGEVSGISLYDDYGHHPEEIKATLKALKESCPERRIVVVFQPHRFSRTQHLLKSFVSSFDDADLLFVAPIYSAGEAPIKGVNSSALVKGIHSYGQKLCVEIENFNDGIEKLLRVLSRNDLFITLGAGDIWKFGKLLKEKLKYELNVKG
ncbi:MAG: UDP-N-acetylmuramate--L-alanine ligase [Nitrospinota bacterium]|nr:UDP-N-acetylmuramate--L-alanine ligase [Nitrospinota bacterium]